MVSFIQSVLSAADINMLLAINGHHNVVFDSIMYTVSDKTIWLPMYMILLVFIIKAAAGSGGLYRQPPHGVPPE